MLEDNLFLTLQPSIRFTVAAMSEGMKFFRRYHLFVKVRNFRTLLGFPREELGTKPTEDIVHNGFRHWDLRIRRETRGFKPDMAEFIDKRF